MGQAGQVLRGRKCIYPQNGGCVKRLCSIQQSFDWDWDISSCTLFKYQGLFGPIFAFLCVYPMKFRSISSGRVRMTKEFKSYAYSRENKKKRQGTPCLYYSNYKIEWDIQSEFNSLLITHHSFLLLHSRSSHFSIDFWNQSLQYFARAKFDELRCTIFNHVFYGLSPINRRC